MSALLWRRFWWGGRGFINPVRRLYSMHHVSKLYECQGAWIDTTKDYTSMWHHEAYTWCIIIAFGNFYLILYRNTYRSSIITTLRYLHRFSVCVLCSFPHPSATLSSPFPSNVILRTKNVQTVSVNSIFSQGSDPMLEFQSLGFTNKPAKHRSFWFLEVSSLV